LNDGGNCGDLLEYMLDGNPDEFNPEGYSKEEKEYANRWKQLYERSKNDANYEIGLFAITQNDELRELSLDEKITNYIDDTPFSILKTQTLERNGQEEKYNSIDLRIEDISTGGAYSLIFLESF
jgi:hypothetical protein